MKKRTFTTRRQSPNPIAPPEKKRSPWVLTSTVLIFTMAIVGFGVACISNSDAPEKENTSQAVAETPPEKQEIPGHGDLGPLGNGVEELIDKGHHSILRLELRTWLTDRLKSGDPIAANDAAFIQALSQYRLLADSKDARLLNGVDRKKRFMMTLMANPEWIQDLLCSGPVNAERSIKSLYTVWRYKWKEVDTPLYRRLSAAIAINNSSDFNMVTAFRHYRQAHQDLLLHASFDDLEVWEMRHAIAYLSDPEFEFVLNERNKQANTYFGACWAVAYRRNNVFGDSIHGRNFYPPWAWKNERYEMMKTAGGVCGSCSSYGSMSAKVHGFPSYTAGEPGHCAYVLRLERDNWRTAYSVTGHTRPHGCFWRPFHYPDLHLMETAFADKQKVRTGYYYYWAAKTLQESVNPSITAEPSISYQLVKANYKKFTTSHSDVMEEGLLSSYRIVKESVRDSATVYVSQLSAAETAGLNLDYKVFGRAIIELDGVLVKKIDGGKRLTQGRHPFSITAGEHELRVTYLDNGHRKHALSIEVSSQNKPCPAAKEYYVKSIRANPFHYGIWDTFGTWTSENETTTADDWKQFSELLLTQLNRFQDAVWMLQLKYPLEQTKDRVSAEELLNRVLSTHRRLKSTKNVRCGIDFEKAASGVEKLLKKDKAKTFTMFEKLFALYADDGKTFSQVIKWGQSRFANDDAYRDRFTTLLSNSGNGNAKIVRWAIGESLKGSIKARDFSGYKTYDTLARNLFKTDSYRERGVNGRWKVPPAKAFPGKIISKHAIIMNPKPGKHDRVFSYSSIVNGTKGGGACYVNKTANPSITLALPGKCTINGIIAASGYENKTWINKFAPLNVYVSQNNKKWTKVHSADKASPIFRIDLGGKSITAKFIKLEVTTKAKETQDMLLRQLTVYGTPHY